MKTLVEIIIQKMGNTFNRNSSSDNDVPTPPIVALTEKEIKIIVETWKIPSANVRNLNICE